MNWCLTFLLNTAYTLHTALTAWSNYQPSELCRPPEPTAWSMVPQTPGPWSKQTSCIQFSDMKWIESRAAWDGMDSWIGSHQQFWGIEPQIDERSWSCPDCFSFTHLNTAYKLVGEFAFDTLQYGQADLDDFPQWLRGGLWVSVGVGGTVLVVKDIYAALDEQWHPKKHDKFVHVCNIYGGVLTQTEQWRMGPTRNTRAKQTFIILIWSGKHGSVLPLYCQHHLSNQHGTFPRSTSTSACRAALATRALLGGLLGIGSQGSRYAIVLWQNSKNIQSVDNRTYSSNTMFRN